MTFPLPPSLIRNSSELGQLFRVRPACRPNAEEFPASA